MRLPPAPWLLVTATACLVAAGALVGTAGRPSAAVALLALGSASLGAWIALQGRNPND
jgi:hypothetical protein